MPSSSCIPLVTLYLAAALPSTPRAPPMWLSSHRIVPRAQDGGDACAMTMGILNTGRLVRASAITMPLKLVY